MALYSNQLSNPYLFHNLFQHLCTIAEMLLLSVLKKKKTEKDSLKIGTLFSFAINCNTK